MMMMTLRWRKQLAIWSLIILLLVSLKTLYTKIYKDVYSNPLTPEELGTLLQSKTSNLDSSRPIFYTKRQDPSLWRQNLYQKDVVKQRNVNYSPFTFDEFHLYEPAKGINPHPFLYIHNNDKICDKDDIYILAFIHSAADHSIHRQLLRKTWMTSPQYLGRNVRTIFLLAATSDKNVQESIDRESADYGDIIQEDFVDHYKNLTYKFIMGLKWTVENCKQARFVVKLDDDVVMDPYTLIHHLTKKYNNITAKNLIACSIFGNIGPRRDRYDKWFVEEKDYPYKLYPRYCEGLAVILSADVIPLLFERSLQTKYYWIDDVWVTGILTAKLGIQLSSFWDSGGYLQLSPYKDTGLAPVGHNPFFLFKYGKPAEHWLKLWTRIKAFHTNSTTTVNSQ